MAVTNTGIVLRTITGVNESDLFLDSEATSVATNTGIVERSIVGVHDANFVRPLGDELVLNGGFDDASNWVLNGWSVSGGSVNNDGINTGNINQNVGLLQNKTYKVSVTISDYVSGSLRVRMGTSTIKSVGSTNGVYTLYLNNTSTNANIRFYPDASLNFIGSIDNISVKEVLVNRESTTTNTGIVERPITGVNESDALFPDNTDSTVVNISDFIIPLLADLEARATTFENREATQNILINLQKC